MLMIRPMLMTPPTTRVVQMAKRTISSTHSLAFLDNHGLEGFGAFWLLLDQVKIALDGDKGDLVELDFINIMLGLVDHATPLLGKQTVG